MVDYKEKIRKLLALAESPVEAEARAALLKARQLMAEHKLTERGVPGGGEAGRPGRADGHHVQQAAEGDELHRHGSPGAGGVKSGDLRGENLRKSPRRETDFFIAPYFPRFIAGKLL